MVFVWICIVVLFLCIVASWVIFVQYMNHIIEKLESQINNTASRVRDLGVDIDGLFTKINHVKSILVVLRERIDQLEEKQDPVNTYSGSSYPF